MRIVSICYHVIIVSDRIGNIVIFIAEITRVNQRERILKVCIEHFGDTFGADSDELIDVKVVGQKPLLSETRGIFKCSWWDGDQRCGLGIEIGEW